MERIKILLQHIIDVSEIKKLEDIEISARIMLASIERGCIDEFSESCLEFSEKKVIERMMEEN